MSDGQIESMVTAIVVENEQIGPHRYIATLGVIFDRTKAAQYLSSVEGGAVRSHSAPMLVIPVLYQGGAGQVFEVRGPSAEGLGQFPDGGQPDRLCATRRRGRRIADAQRRPAGTAQPHLVAHRA